MSKVLVSDKYLTNIANAIRNKNGQNIQYKPSEMANEILAINIGSETKIVDSIIDGSITEVTSNVTYVKEYAFYNDNALVSATLPNATILDNYSFQGCKSLKNITASKVTDICANCFQGCTNLSSISFPNATFADEYAFQNCKTLTSVSLPSLIEMYDYCFAGCSNLVSIDLPLVTNIYQYCFKNCTKLEKVNLPLVTELHTNCFENCSSLKKIILPKTTYIDPGVFTGCNNLKSIVLPNTDEVCSLEKANLPTQKDLYIYVPKALLLEYKVATNWKQYKEQIRAIEDYPNIMDEDTIGYDPDYIRYQEDLSFNNGETSLSLVSNGTNLSSSTYTTQRLDNILNNLKASTDEDFYFEVTINNDNATDSSNRYMLMCIIGSEAAFVDSTNTNNQLLLMITQTADLKYTIEVKEYFNSSNKRIINITKTPISTEVSKSFTIGFKLTHTSSNSDNAYVCNIWSNIDAKSDQHIAYDCHCSSDFDLPSDSIMAVSATGIVNKIKGIKLDFNFGLSEYVFNK